MDIAIYINDRVNGNVEGLGFVRQIVVASAGLGRLVGDDLQCDPGGLSEIRSGAKGGPGLVTQDVELSMCIRENPPRMYEVQRKDSTPSRARGVASSELYELPSAEPGGGSVFGRQSVLGTDGNDHYEPLARRQALKVGVVEAGVEKGH